MNTRHYVTIGGVALAAVMALSMVFVPALATAAYLGVESFSVKEVPTTNPKNTEYKVAAES
jgi:hypothetical protein